MKKVIILLLIAICSINIGYSQQAQTRAQKLRERYLKYPRDPDDVNRVWIMAHRGYWDEENPESSFGAFQNAVNQKFEIIELDFVFSLPFKIERSGSVYDKNGQVREIMFSHDHSPNRTDAIGLFKFAGHHTFSEEAYTNVNGTKVKYVKMDNLLPIAVVNSIDGPNGEHPILLKLNGENSSFKMIHFPSNATLNNNDDLKKFTGIVKDKILINLDKLSTPLDFQNAYDLFKSAELLDQAIFKGKGIRSFDDIENKFGVRDISKIMFTPIFTHWDFCKEVGNKKVDDIDENGKPYKHDTKLAAAIKCVDDLIKAENEQKIVFPGCEVIYEKGNVDTEWLSALAQYLHGRGKLVIQFSSMMDSKSGAWNGNGNNWSSLLNRGVNYWSWLFNNPLIKNNGIRPDVFVGDKPIAFRSYLNSLGYNQKPID